MPDPSDFDHALYAAAAAFVVGLAAWELWDRIRPQAATAPRDPAGAHLRRAVLRLAKRFRRRASERHARAVLARIHAEQTAADRLARKAAAHRARAARLARELA